MAANELRVIEAREWVRNGRVLVKRTGDEIQIPACGLSVEEQAAVCYVLLSALQDRCGIAPFAVQTQHVESVLDCLSSISEFPGINQD